MPKLTSENFLKDLDYSVVQQCMHCGMCLPSCPTYQETGFERNSPRGRISLMRSIADEQLELNKSFGEEMYYCLGCLACVTACPANVDYPTLFEMARGQIEAEGVLDTPKRKFYRWLSINVIFTKPTLLRLIGRLLYLYQKSGLQTTLRSIGFMNLLPKELKALEPDTPTVNKRFSNDLIRPVETPEKTKYKVGLLTGCVQDILFSDINRDTVDVLLANACEVITPQSQYCCGSLHAHNGAIDLARDLARKSIDSFDLENLDAIITNAAGCGSHLKHYSTLLKNDTAYADKARLWDSKVKDIHEWLVEIGFRNPADTNLAKQRVTYHEACHLCHGQAITSQPREIIKSLPHLELIEMKGSSECCGSAGIYSITQPEQANKLLEKKVENIGESEASCVVMANPGCHLHVEKGLKKSKCSSIPVRHSISLLAEAYRRESK